ncbi:hypothetical protein GCM10009113_04210 [Marinobacter szutsaonensis]
MAHVRFFRHYIHLPFLILGLIDFLILILAFCLSVFLAFFGDIPFFIAQVGYVLPSAVAFALLNLFVMVAIAVHQARLEEGSRIVAMSFCEPRS